MMIRLIPLLIILSSWTAYAADKISAYEKMEQWKNFDTVLKSLPKDAAKALDDVVTCQHLSGELDGDSEHDQAIFKLMQKWQCDTADKRFDTAKIKYKNKPNIQKAFHIYYE